MITVDTNILVRLFIDDENKHQVKIARELALEAKRVYVAQIVQVELVWVLKSLYNMPKEHIINILNELHENGAYELQEQDVFQEALSLFKSHSCDFSDCIILVESRRSEASAFYTFDKKLAKLPGARLLNSAMLTEA